MLAVARTLCGRASVRHQTNSLGLPPKCVAARYAIHHVLVKKILANCSCYMPSLFAVFAFAAAVVSGNLAAPLVS